MPPRTKLGHYLSPELDYWIMLAVVTHIFTCSSDNVMFKLSIWFKFRFVKHDKFIKDATGGASFT